jgi:beta-lactamase class D
MKNNILMSLLIIFTFDYSPANSAKNFLLIDLNPKKIIAQEGDINTRTSPCSTFKIALSLMGFDSDILKDANTPKWPFKQGYSEYLEIWKQPHTPQLWLKNSCIWYSRLLIKQLGAKRFAEYIKKLTYGNQDISGDAGKNNGLTNAWLSSSLKISPAEQSTFLTKLIKNELAISKQSQEITKQLLFLENLPNNYKLYGKTGCGNHLKSDLSYDKNRLDRWFIGWITDNTNTYVFVNSLTDLKKTKLSGKSIAKTEVVKYLTEFIQQNHQLLE